MRTLEVHLENLLSERAKHENRIQKWYTTFRFDREELKCSARIIPRINNMHIFRSGTNFNSNYDCIILL